MLDKKVAGGSAAIKFHIVKAFHTFSSKCLAYFLFHDTFCNWIKGYTSFCKVIYSLKKNTCADSFA